MDIRACLFDVFGTVVDWRSSVSRDLAEFGKAKGIGGIDWLEFAVEWRKLYQPSMEEVRSGRRPFTILDVLHRESLDKLVSRTAFQFKGGGWYAEGYSKNNSKNASSDAPGKATDAASTTETKTKKPASSGKD